VERELTLLRAQRANFVWSGAWCLVRVRLFGCGVRHPLKRPDVKPVCIGRSGSGTARMAAARCSGTGFSTAVRNLGKPSYPLLPAFPSNASDSKTWRCRSLSGWCGTGLARDGKVRWWDLPTGDRPESPEHHFRAKGGHVKRNCFAKSRVALCPHTRVAEDMTAQGPLYRLGRLGVPSQTHW